jgi:hypothetical protein
MAQLPVTSTNQNVLTSNRLQIMFGGVLVGAMQSMRLSDGYSLDAVYGIGDIDPIENVPTRASYGFSVSNYVLKLATLRTLGLVPENGAATLAGLVFDVQVVSRDTNLVLRTVKSASYNSGDTDIRATAIIGQNSNWMALGIFGKGI